MDIELEHVRILRPEPGDIIVYCTEVKLRHDTATSIMASLRDLFPDNKCGILDADGRLVIVRPGEE